MTNVSHVTSLKGHFNNQKVYFKLESDASFEYTIKHCKLIFDNGLLCFFLCLTLFIDM